MKILRPTKASSITTRPESPNCPQLTTFACRKTAQRQSTDHPKHTCFGIPFANNTAYLRMQIFLQKLCPSPHWHYTKSDLAQHRIQPASFKHRTKSGKQCIIHCDRFRRGRHESGTLSSGSAKSPAGPEFCAGPPGLNSASLVLLIVFCLPVHLLKIIC